MTNKERAEEIIKELAENYPDRSRLETVEKIKQAIESRE